MGSFPAAFCLSKSHIMKVLLVALACPPLCRRAPAHKITWLHFSLVSAKCAPMPSMPLRFCLKPLDQKRRRLPTLSKDSALICPYFGDQCKLLVDTVVDYIDQNDTP